MFFRLLDRFEGFLLALLLAAMTVVTFSQVFMRYVLNETFHWALEFVVVCFAWLIFLGVSYGVRVGSHIGVEAFVRILPAQAARLLSIVTVLLCLFYCGILTIGGWDYTAKLLKIGVDMQDLPIPRWVPTIIVPLGFALTFLRFLQVLIRLLTGKQTRLDLADEVKETLESDINIADKETDGRDEGRR